MMNRLNKKILRKSTNKVRGFTLIELLVVVSVLAAIAGMTSVALDGYQQDAEEKLTRVEMQRIANAIRRFKEDTGYWPKTGIYDLGDITSPASIDSYKTDYYANPADLRWLFYQPEIFIEGQEHSGSWSENLDKHPLWDIEYAIGWHGPYIDIPAAREIVAAIDCQTFNNTEMTALLSEPSGYPTQLKRRSIGIVDRFERNWRRSDSNNYCVTSRDQDDANQYIPDFISGSPYLYETNYIDSGSCSSGCIVLRSLGKDSRSTASNDDLIFILHVNS